MTHHLFFKAYFVSGVINDCASACADMVIAKQALDLPTHRLKM
jgi:hypothetical protein